MNLILSPVDQLEFTRPLTEIVVVSTLTLTAPDALADIAWAYKIKTTAPKQYCVRPSAGLVMSGQTVEVKVLLQPMDEEPAWDYKCRDKFMIQSFPIPSSAAVQLEPTTTSHDDHDDDTNEASSPTVGGGGGSSSYNNTNIWSLAQAVRVSPEAPMNQVKVRVVFSPIPAPMDGGEQIDNSINSSNPPDHTATSTLNSNATDAQTATNTATTTSVGTATTVKESTNIDTNIDSKALALALAESKRLQQMCDKYQRELLSIRSELRQRNVSSTSSTSSSHANDKSTGGRYGQAATKVHNNTNNNKQSFDVKILVAVALVAFLLGSWLF